MRVLDELEREVERIAREAGERRGRRRWWRSTAVIIVLTLGLGTVAVAATTQILSGEPVKNPAGLRLDPKSGLGVIVGSGKVFDVQAAEPSGGPPWGLRMVRTSRGFGCVQLGRLLDGKLGVIGRDGAFDNDGKFHERGAEILQTTDCQQTDGAGNVFIAMSHVGLPASGDMTGCVIRANAQPPRPQCAPQSLRNIFYGLLGPEAEAVTYEDPSGQIVRQPVSQPEGAYVVVRPTDPKARNIGYFSPGVTPGSGLKSVEYRDGTTCEIVSARRIGGARRCPLKGFVTPKLDIATRAELTSTVRLRVGQRQERPGDVPKGVRVAAQRRITISFRARRSADARSFYTVTVQMKRGGRRCLGMTLGPIAKDVTAGTVLTERRYVSYRCRGTLEVRVGYTQQRRPSAMPFDIGGFGNAKVGIARVKVE